MMIMSECIVNCCFAAELLCKQVNKRGSPFGKDDGMKELVAPQKPIVVGLLLSEIHFFTFLTCVSITSHVIDVGWTSVCPSVHHMLVLC